MNIILQTTDNKEYMHVAAMPDTKYDCVTDAMYRTEHDTLGARDVPEGALHGIRT